MLDEMQRDGDLHETIFQMLDESIGFDDPTPTAEDLAQWLVMYAGAENDIAASGDAKSIAESLPLYGVPAAIMLPHCQAWRAQREQDKADDADDQGGDDALSCG
jgi:hypothetical protein